MDEFTTLTIFTSLTYNFYFYSLKTLKKIHINQMNYAFRKTSSSKLCLQTNQV